jgi:CheY-like chemotaxis protein
MQGLRHGREGVQSEGPGKNKPGAEVAAEIRVKGELMVDFVLPKQSILIVDDVPDNIRVLVETLMSDYDIHVATNGIDAIDYALSDPPDLILLDIMMPKMDGYEVCKHLKNNKKTQNIPVIFITAKNDIDDETRGFELDAVDYITKPFSIAVVLARVHTHLALKQHRDNLTELVKIRDTELKRDTDGSILRSIKFPPEYKHAGISILNYFGTVLLKKYPDTNATVHIKQDGLKVIMIIDTSDGDREIIEKELDNYGMVITGKITPEAFTDDRHMIMEIKQELRIAQLRIETQKDLLEDKTAQVNKLLSIVGNAVQRDLNINLNTSNKQGDTINIDAGENAVVSKDKGTSTLKS